MVRRPRRCSSTRLLPSHKKDTVYMSGQIHRTHLPIHTDPGVNMPFPSIAVVGGGLSGLVLARILQRHDIACTVYELDADANARRQGGLLDLHVESGQLALREAGLYEQFRRLIR